MAALWKMIPQRGLSFYPREIVFQRLDSHCPPLSEPRQLRRLLTGLNEMAVARILSIGTELTRGLTVDTNAAWLSRRLGSMGMPVDQVRAVPDDEDAITRAIGELTGGADAVFLTGGLGPTQDDLTREGLARAMGVVLEERSEQVAVIRSYFEARHREMPASNIRQAMAPLGATIIPNAMGTAPGLRARIGDCTVFAMPGVPSEMQAMFVGHVVEELRAIGRGRVVAWRTLNCFGSGESDMARIALPILV